MTASARARWESMLDGYRSREASGEHAWVNAAIRMGVRALVLIGQRVQGVAFPGRATGGWWWTWRWRAEVLLGLNEHESVAWCRRVVGRGGTAIDVGAHIGYYSRVLSRCVGPSGRVHAFEAASENIAILRHNLRRARFRNVTVHHAACADRDGTAVLHLSPGSSNHSLIAGFTEEQGTELVPAVTLDRFCADAGIGQVEIIKLDVEGGELAVLAGMRGLLARRAVRAMLVEYNPTALRAAGHEPSALVAGLEAAGFEVCAILPDGSLADPAERADGLVNLACLVRAGVSRRRDAGRPPSAPG